MTGATDKYYEQVIAVLLLLVNIGCIFLYYLIAVSVSGSDFERTALSVYLEYLSWAVLVLFAVTLASSNKIKESRVIAIVLTILNIFAVLGGVVSSMPFRL
jgi:cytochrome bd-type quinol oxidase subunit 2